MQSVQSLTVEVPEPLVRRLRRIAEITHRSVEDVLTTTVNAALPPAHDLPADLADEVAALTFFNDEALWAAAESSLTPAQQRRLNQLSHAGGSRPLTRVELAEMAYLIELYDRSVVMRARALAVLAQRGYRIPDQVALSGVANESY
ncbi:MAG: hypothetical protein AB1791_11490 [Chloroflexota bacterium]